MGTVCVCKIIGFELLQKCWNLIKLLRKRSYKILPPSVVNSTILTKFPIPAPLMAATDTI